MGKSQWRAGLWVSWLLASAIACSGSSSKGDGPSNVPDSVCTAGSSRCDGLNVKVCNEDGTGETIQATCLPSQSCSDGACRETACVANTRFCKNSAVWKCDSTGGGSALAEACPVGFFCRESEGDARCSDQACTAGERLCQGTVATVCEADGSGPRAGGMDCAESKQACYDGECRDISCTAGTKLCQHDDVYLCAESGTDISLFADCRDDEVCDGAQGACRAKLCEPGKSSCEGTRVTTCNEYGSAWLPSGTDCAASGDVCLEGSCRKQVCNPSRSYCEDGAVYSCDSTGSVATLHDECTAGWSRCVQYSSYAYCSPTACQAGDVFCDGDVIKKCDENGDVPATGTTCKASEYCSEATCKPRGCTEGEYFCKDSDIYYCAHDGAYLSQLCPDQTTCQGAGGAVTCVPPTCQADSAACLGNKVGTCAADGKSLSKVTEDCAANASICGADLKCAKAAVDTLVVAESVEPVGGGTFVGDAIEVTSARKLTEFSVNLVLAGPRELRWVLYEQSGTSFVARVDKVVSTPASAGFISSGPFSYALKAGKRYLLGVVVGGGDGVVYYDTAPYPRHFSFGTLIGRVNYFYEPTIGSDYYYSEQAYQVRVATEVP